MSSPWSSCLASRSTGALPVISSSNILRRRAACPALQQPTSSSPAAARLRARCSAPAPETQTSAATKATTQISSSTAVAAAAAADTPRHSVSPPVGQERELVALEQLAKEELKYGWLMFWIGSAVAFGAGIWAVEGPSKAQEFFAGYILEQSLSVDNLFVFVLVFGYFKTPPSGQSQVLGYGIATAAVLRAILIVAGVELIADFEPLLIGFAAILLFSAYKLFFNSSSDEEDGDLTDNDVVKFCRRFINTTDAYDGNNFFTVLADGTRRATPLLLTLAVVELSDVLFAVDSIPAVFGVTLDPFIVYTSNIFAILSLRAVYSFVATAMTQVRYLDKSVAVVLAFIGTKMLLEVGGIDIPTDVSLLTVGLVLGTGIGASLLLPEPEAEE